MSAHNLGVVLAPSLFQAMNPNLITLTREFIIHHTLLFLVSLLILIHFTWSQAEGQEVGGQRAGTCLTQSADLMCCSTQSEPLLISECVMCLYADPRLGSEGGRGAEHRLLMKITF